jgi:hypothetical protein
MNRFVQVKNLAFFCTVLLIGGFIIGYVATLEGKPDKLHKLDVSELEHEEQIENNREEVTVDQTAGNRISLNTRLIFQTRYSECGHTVVERKEVPTEIVDFDEHGVKEYYQPWEIKEFSNEEIVLTRQVEGICPKHYLLGVQDGYIAVYEFGENGKPVLKEITDIPISILRLNDQHRLRKGILLDSIEEVNQFLEEFSS